MMARALREGWPMSEEKHREAVERMLSVFDDPDACTRERLVAARAVLIFGRRLDHAIEAMQIPEDEWDKQQRKAMEVVEALERSSKEPGDAGKESAPA